MIALLTAMLTPAILALVTLTALWRSVDITAALAAGAMEGLRVLLRMTPHLIALLTAVTIFRASGLPEALAALLAPALGLLGIPAETFPLLLVRPISGSGALGLGAELIRTYGPDSTVGRTAAVMLSSTETTFYVISVYFGAAGLKKTRFAIPAALCADLIAFVTAAWAVRLFAAA